MKHGLVTTQLQHNRGTVKQAEADTHVVYIYIYIYTYTLIHYTKCSGGTDGCCSYMYRQMKTLPRQQINRQPADACDEHSSGSLSSTQACLRRFCWCQ